MPISNKWFDVSMLVTESTPVYPGDTPFQLRWLSSDPIRTSEITITPHVGTHIDAPTHFGYSGDLTNAPLDVFAGRCIVIEAKNEKPVLEYTAVQNKFLQSKILTPQED